MQPKAYTRPRRQKPPSPQKIKFDETLHCHRACQIRIAYHLPKRVKSLVRFYAQHFTRQRVASFELGSETRNGVRFFRATLFYEKSMLTLQVVRCNTALAGDDNALANMVL